MAAVSTSPPGSNRSVFDPARWRAVPFASATTLEHNVRHYGVTPALCQVTRMNIFLEARCARVIARLGGTGDGSQRGWAVSP